LQKYDHCPKVLILSNKNRSCDHFDLDVALKGFLKSEQGKEFWVAPDVAFGIIKEIKFKIDLYIWVDLIKPIIYEIESGKKISRWRKFYFVHTTKIGKDLAAGLKNRFKSN